MPSRKKESSVLDLNVIQIDDEESEEAGPTPEAIVSKNTDCEARNSRGMDVVLPTAEWFDENWGPEEEEGTTSSNINAIKSPKKRKMKKSTAKLAKKRKMEVENSKADEVITISDGEDLDTVFPTTLAEGAKTNTKMKKKSAKTKHVEDGVDPSLPMCALRRRLVEDDDEPIVIGSFVASTSQSFKERQELVNRVKKIKCEALMNDSIVEERKLNSRCKSESTMQMAELEGNGIMKNFNPHFGIAIKHYIGRFQSQFDEFNKKIWDHHIKHFQNDYTYRWKMRVRNALQASIRSLYPNSTIFAVGSTVNGCGAYNSDMDLCLAINCPIERYDTSRSYAIKHLKKVRKYLSASNLIRRIDYIPAKVPILKIICRHPYATLEVDMNVNNTAGIRNSFLLHNYSRLDDRLSALCLIVKHWAKSNGIGDASEGFLNSYSLILMVVHFLQCGVDPFILPNLQHLYSSYFRANRPFDEMEYFTSPKPSPEPSKNEQKIGELVLGFFDYYNRFDFDRHAISIRMGSVFDRTELPSNTDRFKLFIEEPYDQQNTARCVTNIEHWMIIKDAIGKAAHALSPSSRRPPDLERIGVLTASDD